MAIERVALRVSRGGHNIPTEVIERRFASGIQNLKKYIEMVDVWAVYDNSKSPAQIIARGGITSK
ncbi:MAG: hypothetical protein ACTHK0_13795 [Ginsengibacter sp.]